MFWFTIRKSIIDTLDNIAGTFLINLGFILLIVFLFLTWAVLPPVFALRIGSIVFALLVLVFYFGGIAVYANEKAAGKGVQFFEFFSGIKRTWKANLFLSLFLMFLIYIFGFVLRYYVAVVGNLLGFFLMSVVLWFSIILLLSFQYYYPFFLTVETRILRLPKVLLQFLIDNTLFSIGIMFFTVLVLSPSILVLLFGPNIILFIFVVLLAMFPGVTGILMLTTNAVRLRMKKYEYLKQNPEVSRKRIPWDALLREERQKIGRRSFLGLFFPWKD